MERKNKPTTIFTFEHVPDLNYFYFSTLTVFLHLKLVVLHWVGTHTLIFPYKYSGNSLTRIPYRFE